MTECIVIGSGPSGVAVASALIERGTHVLMIDGGKKVEMPPLAVTLRDAPPDKWSKSARAAWQEPQFKAPAGHVRRYGSDAALEPAGKLFASVNGSLGLGASLASGGLSNLWGAAVARNRGDDFAGWPVSGADLAPHYDAIAQIMPVAGAGTGAPSRPDLSPQAAELLRRAGRLKADAPGFELKPAAVAVAPGCNGCGMCLHGCPLGLIWRADQAFEALRQSGRFDYRNGPPVRQVRENGEGVEVTLADGATLAADRLYVGAGVVQTARLLLQSGLAEELTLRDSQFGFLPILHSWRSPSPPDRIPFTTLPQLFFAMQDTTVSPHGMHGQIYSWNEYYGREMVANYGRGLRLTRPVFDIVARHLLVAQIFLHSDHGARIGLRLAGGDLTATVTGAPDLARLMGLAARRLGRCLSGTGLVPIGRALRVSQPGESFHVGASLPMSHKPETGQSDTLGRPFGLSRIHVVDASVLPAIAAPTVTYTVMANAHRIGRLSA